MLTRWLAYEQTLLAKLNRFPRSATPRERMLMLVAIRLGALGLALLLFGLLGISAGVLTDWRTGALAGAVTLVVGSTLLTLVITLGAILILVYGD